MFTGKSAPKNTKKNKICTNPAPRRRNCIIKSP
jgi:hypothetical protein